MQFAAVTVTRSSEQVARQIEAHIRGTELMRGRKLPTEREMGEQFGVSRGVVREAIEALSAQGLVASRQGSGNDVRNRGLTLSVAPETASVQAAGDGFLQEAQRKDDASKCGCLQPDRPTTLSLGTTVDSRDR